GQAGRQGAANLPGRGAAGTGQDGRAVVGLRQPRREETVARNALVHRQEIRAPARGARGGQPPHPAGQLPGPYFFGRGRFADGARTTWTCEYSNNAALHTRGSRATQGDSQTIPPAGQVRLSHKRLQLSSSSRSFASTLRSSSVVVSWVVVFPPATS